jgi:hypothetical protein
MLDDVGDEDPLSIDARRLERLVEDPPGRPDEDVALEILAIAGLLTD